MRRGSIYIVCVWRVKSGLQIVIAQSILANKCFGKLSLLSQVVGGVLLAIAAVCALRRYERGRAFEGAVHPKASPSRMSRFPFMGAR